MIAQKQVKLSTDGACIGNPGPGGWGCILRFGGHVGELFGCDLRLRSAHYEPSHGTASRHRRLTRFAGTMCDHHFNRFAVCPARHYGMACTLESQRMEKTEPQKAAVWS